jgi:hypothetical protein
MSELRIQTIWYRNFKGLRKFDLVLNGQDADLIAQNGTGKTTVADGFQWLVSDKNTAHDKKFSIKTLQESGESLHGFEHEVGMVIAIDGEEITLQKIHHETYEKKRGSARESFTGHTNVYRINDLKVTEKAFKARIAEIFGDETTFRLLTDLGFFNDDKAFGWEKRRALLMQMSGDVSDNDVIESNAELAGLAELLKSRRVGGVDDLKAWLKEQRKKINEDLEEFQPRIDEVSRNLPETSGTTEAVESDLLKIRTAVQEKHQEKARLDSGGEVAEKTKRLRELEAERLAHENDARKQIEAENQKSRQELTLWTNRIDECDRNTRSLEQDIESNSAKIRHLEGQMESLRDQWQESNAETFEKDMEEHDTTCYACGQDLPVERIQEARDKALAAFNKQKAEKLENIDALGKQAKAEAAGLALQNEKARSDIAEIAEARAEITATIDALPSPDTEATVATSADSGAIVALKAEIESLGEGNTDALAAVSAEIADMQQQINDGEAKLADFQQVVQGKERIEELKDQEKTLGAQYEEYERQLHLCEEFIKAQAAMLTERINSRFGMTQFKLFETQINEGIKPCCVAIHKGKPYPDLSTGEKIHVDLDVITTLSDYYGIICPVFVDHAESVTSPLKAPGQVIRLIARVGVSELTVETPNLKEAVS